MVFTVNSNMQPKNKHFRLILIFNFHKGKKVAEAHKEIW